MPARYRQVAEAYRSIWEPGGSPLKVHGMKVRDGLLKQMRAECVVELAMRYQNPSLESVLATSNTMVKR